MEDTLVICIGNVARGDDGVGWEVARLLVEDPPVRARILTATALDVTHAQDVAAVSRLIVVDAKRRSAPAIETIRISPGGVGRDTHGMTPGALTGLAESLYGQRPADCRLVSVAAPEMDHGEGLSPVAADAARHAADEVGRLCAEPHVES